MYIHNSYFKRLHSHGRCHCVGLSGCVSMEVAARMNVKTGYHNCPTHVPLHRQQT